MVRLWAIVAGVLGVVAAITGGAGLIAKPDAIVWASTPLDRPVVVIPPQVLAMDGVLDVVVEAEPYTEIRTAQPGDVYAWLRGENSIVVRGVSSWTEVATVRPNIYSYDGNDRTGDIWRSNTVGYGAIHIRPDDVPPGLAVVVITRSHTPLDKVSIQLSRNPGYEWAWPTISLGALLAAVSIILFAIAWLAPEPGLEPARQEAEVVTPSRPRKQKSASDEPISGEAVPKGRAAKGATSKAPPSVAPEPSAPVSYEPPAERPLSRRARRALEGEK